MSTEWSHTHRAVIPAEPSAVFLALTDGAALCAWFAEHAEVEPAIEGRFLVWGRYVPGQPQRAEADGRVVSLKAMGSLVFDWRFLGLETRVAINLERVNADVPRTSLSLRHDFPAPIAAPRPRELVDDYWRLAIGNLTAYLGDGVGLVRPDFSDPHPEVRATIYIAAPPAAVFRALTEPQALNQWIAASATVDLRVGGSMAFGWSYEVDGRTVVPVSRILEIVPNERLVMDWPDWRGDPSVPRQTIRWDLEAIPTGTRVTLTHSGFVRAVDIGDYGFGWAEFLSRLRTCAEQTR